MTTSHAHRWWALAGMWVAVLTLGFDITIMNVALPTLATDLSAGTDALQWMTNAYVLVLAGLMLVCGALGDRYGRRRLLLIGLALFGASSAVAPWVDSAAGVIAARTVMGISAAIILPVIFALLPVLFGPDERGRAVSLTVVAVGLGIPLGPILGGWLLEHFWWGSIFLINVPMAVLAVVAIAWLLPESRDTHPRRPDVPGGLLSTVGLLGLVYGCIEAPNRGWSDPLVLAAVALGAALLVAFVVWENHTRDPMIDLPLFRRREFLGGSIGGVLVTFGLLGLLFVIPQYLQLVLGHDPLATGLRLLPLMGGLVIGAPLGERLAARVGYRAPVAAGLTVLAAALAVGATTSLDSGYGFVAGWLAAAGLGIGLALSPAMDAVLSALPEDRAGSGTAIAMTLRQTGGALGVAVLGSVLAQGYTSRLDITGLPPAVADVARESVAGGLAVAQQLNNAGLAASASAAYVHGMTLVLVVTAAVTALSAVVVTAILQGRKASQSTPDARDASLQRS